MKKYSGQDFYDDPTVFKKYLQHRQRIESPNETIEKPIILELTQTIQGDVLDLGCGYGDLSVDLIDQGIHHYTGIDASDNMIRLALSQFASPVTTFLRANIEEWAFPHKSFDWVISRLVFHYLDDLDQLFNQLHHTLREKGQLVFSVEHPLITSSMHLPVKNEEKKEWVVDQYFELGRRSQKWMDGLVIKYHRSLEEYWRLLTKNGFQVKEIREGCPLAKHFSSEEEYEKRKKIPRFLIVKANKV